MAVFSDQGVLTAGQKIPARDSESPAEERPDRGTPRFIRIFLYCKIIGCNCKYSSGKEYYKMDPDKVADAFNDVKGPYLNNRPRIFGA
jgi:hypothetical protein